MSRKNNYQDFTALNNAALYNSRSLLASWLPGGKFCGDEYVVRNPTRIDNTAGSFLINVSTGRWCDFATGERGSNFQSLYAYIFRASYVDAGNELARLFSAGFTTASASTAPPKKGGNTKWEKQKFALALWKESRSSAGTVVEQYLQARGLKIQAPPCLRVLLGHRHRSSGLAGPVMLAAIQSWSKRLNRQEIIAVHRTWLSADGRGKADVSPNKMMLGSVQGGAVRLSPVAEKLIVCEGIETGLSLLQATKLPVWCALSTSGMVGLVLPEPPLAQKIIIAADHDSLGIDAANQAADLWSAQGRDVHIAVPPQENTDFNDLLCSGYATDIHRRVLCQNS